MFVFRTYEKLGALYKFGCKQLGYWIVCILLFAVVVLILGYRFFINILKRFCTTSSAFRASLFLHGATSRFSVQARFG